MSQLSKLGWEVHYATHQSFLDIPYIPIPNVSPASATLAGDHQVNVESDPTLAEGVILKMVQRLPDPDVGRMKKPRLVSAVCERVAQEVGRIAGRGWLPLTLGGDHSLVSLSCVQDLQT